MFCILIVLLRNTEKHRLGEFYEFMARRMTDILAGTDWLDGWISRFVSSGVWSSSLVEHGCYEYFS